MTEFKEEIKELFNDLVLFKNPDKRIKVIAVLFWICIIYLIAITINPDIGLFLFDFMNE